MNVAFLIRVNVARMKIGKGNWLPELPGELNHSQGIGILGTVISNDTVLTLLALTQLSK